ncbi:MAG: hypothetical protein IPL28_03435 [Chloroflexi bacterium]|nr:hypothetical protein [Chloroflexota bacterium]
MLWFFAMNGLQVTGSDWQVNKAQMKDRVIVQACSSKWQKEFNAKGQRQGAKGLEEKMRSVVRKNG